MQEKRAHKRKLLLAEAVIADASGSAWSTIVLLDISSIGVAFASAQIMERDDIRMLRFCLPGSPRRHDAAVCVVHSSSAGVPSGYRVGAKFSAIDPATLELIADFVGFKVLS